MALVSCASPCPVMGSGGGLRTGTGDALFPGMPPRRLLAPLFCLLVLAGTCFATTTTYTVSLSGAAEAVPTGSPGLGTATLVYDDLSHDLQLTMSFSGLLGITTAAHIHAATALPFTGTAGVATTTPSFSGFPSGVTAGSYSTVLDLDSLSSFNAAYVTAHGGTAGTARVDLVAALDSGKAYLNIHTRSFPAGEIRGFVVRVPEASSTVILLGAALSGLGLLARARRRA